MSSCDVAVAMEEFLRDPEQASLELPHMTTGQRKSTKKMLEKYPELQCESYGFGAERKLVLFKQGAQKAPQYARKSEEGRAAIIQLDGINTASGEESVANFGETTPESCKVEDLSPSRRNHAPSPQGSPVASLPDTSERLQVRNTFIHFERLSQTDERAVQSMPHGMFKQCIQAEVSQSGQVTPSTRSGYDTPDTPTSVSERESLMEFVTANVSNEVHEKHLELSLGALVIVEGLTKVPAFNGCSAVIQGWDEDTKRYNIMLAAPGGCQQAKVKQENLRVVMHCP